MRPSEAVTAADPPRCINGDGRPIYCRCLVCVVCHRRECKECVECEVCR